MLLTKEKIIETALYKISFDIESKIGKEGGVYVQFKSVGPYQNMENPIKTHRPDHSFLWHHNVINCFLGGSTNNAPARFFI